MPNERLVPDYTVTIDGSELSSTLLSRLNWIEIEQSIGLIDMAVLSFENPAGAIADAAEFGKGKEIEIEIGYVGEKSWAFKGDIVSLEPCFPVGGTPAVLVRCYDRLHRYRRGRKQRTFLNQKVSDVIQALAGEDGLSADVEATQDTHDFLLQNNQTNIDMIHELARRNGFEVDVVDGSTLRIKKPRYDSGKAHTLQWNKDLKSFYVRSSVANVPTEVVVRHWDMKKKESVSEKQKELHGRLEAVDEAPKVAKKAFGDAVLQVSLRPNTAPNEAKALAWGLFNEQALDAVKGRGTCMGEPAIKPGIVLELVGLGKTWSGLYYVTKATHLLHRSSGFSTAFEVRRNGTGYDSPNAEIKTAPPGEAEPPEPSQSMSASVTR